MKTLLLAILFLTPPLLADTSAAFPPNPHETQGGKRAPTFSKANAQAIYWINLIDQHQFGPSWLEASSLVQDITTRQQWAAAMKETRLNLGVVSSRKVSSHQTATTLPGGTKGNFMIIKYETNYSRKPNMVETITLMTQGQLSQWKVVSYKIGKS